MVIKCRLQQQKRTSIYFRRYLLSYKYHNQHEWLYYLWKSLNIKLFNFLIFNIIKVQNKIYGNFAGKVDVSAKLLRIYLILAFYWQTMKHRPSVTCRYLSDIKTFGKWKSLENQKSFAIHFYNLVAFLYKQWQIILKTVLHWAFQRIDGPIMNSLVLQFLDIWHCFAELIAFIQLIQQNTTPFIFSHQFRYHTKC